MEVVRRFGRVVSAIGYNGVATGFAQCLSLLRGVTLTRLLSPEAFGVFGIVSMTGDALSAATNFDLRTLVITVPFEQEVFKKRWLDSVYFLEILRSVVIFLLIWAISSKVGRFYRNSELPTLLVVAGVAYLVLGFTNSGFALYEREINYRKVVILEQLAVVVNFCVAIGLTFWRKDAIIFVLAILAANILKVVLSFAWQDYRPSLRFDWAVLRKCIGYGKYFLVVGLLTYCTTQFDNLVVGKYMGLAALGIYLMAYKLAMMPVDLIAQIVVRALLPYYSELYREDVGASFEKWAKNLVCLAWVFACCAIVIWAGGTLIVSTVYGKTWCPTETVLSLLGVVGLFRGLAQGSGTMLVAMNRPDLNARAKFLEALLFVPLVLLLVPKFGMSGAASAGVCSYLVGFATRNLLISTFKFGSIGILYRGLARVLLGASTVVTLILILMKWAIPMYICVFLTPPSMLCVGLLLEPQLRNYSGGAWRRILWSNTPV